MFTLIHSVAPLVGPTTTRPIIITDSYIDITDYLAEVTGTLIRDGRTFTYTLGHRYSDGSIAISPRMRVSYREVWYVQES